MKNIKRICTLIMVLAMVLAMAVPAMAAETSTITINNSKPGVSFAAYRLLNATEGDSGNVAYTFNEKYEAILKEVTEKTTLDDVTKHISELDAAGMRAFAEAVYSKITEAKLEPDATTSNNVFADIEQGYYLIDEIALGSDVTNTRSLVMVDTLGKNGVTIETKESIPTVDKEVWNYNDSTGENHWGEHADYDVGDTIKYRITGRVSGEYENYTNYWYQIVDEMSAGLTYNNDAKITIGGVDVTSQFTKVEGVVNNGFAFEADLKALTGVTVNHNSMIIVEYTCTLNENAVSGAPGNPNDVYIRFQNDPYAEGKPEKPGETPKDTNIVFTYDAIVNKTDGKNFLKGAGFTLYKFNAEQNEWVAVGPEIKGADIVTFKFEKLDKGIYKLVETTVPSGYNKANDIEFHIHPEYDTTKDPIELKALKVVSADGKEMENFTIDMTKGSVTTVIVNKAGVELPTTGGMGTTLFYVFGGILVAAAVVLLVTKKRMNADV